MKASRRNVFKIGGSLGLGLVGSKLAHGAVTPPQTEGPFYPTVDQQDKDVDLTKVAGKEATKLGKKVLVRGKIIDDNGKPLSGAVVDVWQACATGKYNHPRDPNPAKLDPNFQYFARMISGTDGSFAFKTIIPGAYQATNDWARPPHIHFRVEAWRKKRLTTQMYFAGEKLNDKDRILIDTEKQYGKAAKDSLIVDFSKTDSQTGLPTGLFTITIGSTPIVD